MSIPPFHYAALDTSKDVLGLAFATRLIRLSPSSEFEADICCEMLEVQIWKAKELNISYAALSYAWGDNAKEGNITVNGRTLRIKPNLEEALRYLRPQHQSMTLWVDAICINQDDILERNHQVQNMKALYSQAAVVFAWIGADVPAPEPGWELIQAFHREYGTGTEATTDDTCNEAYVALTKRIEKPSILELVQINKMLGKDYWSRLWIIQEIAVAREVVVVNGHLRSNWAAFRTWARIRLSPELRSMSHRLSRISTGKPVPWRNNRPQIFDHIPLVHEGFPYHPSDLLSLLERCQRSQAVEPRDKVYGVLGLLDMERSEQNLPIDYNASLAQVFVEVVKFAYAQSHNLDFLSHVHISRLQSRHLEGLPSWAPDWTKAPDFRPLRLAYSSQNNSSTVFRLFSATKGVTKHDIKLTFGEMSLCIQGFRLGSIQVLTSTSRTSETAWQEEWTDFGGLKLAGLQMQDHETIFGKLAGENASIDEDLLFIWRVNTPYPDRNPVQRAHDAAPSHEAQDHFERYCRTVVGDTWVGSRGSSRLSMSLELAEICDIPPRSKEQLERLKIGFLENPPQYCAGRKLFRTQEEGRASRLGLAPTNARVGDIVCAFFGGDVLYLVRETSQGTEFVGEW
jgi:hypothetical protein